MPTDETLARQITPAQLASIRAPARDSAARDSAVPAYLRDVYHWAYLSPVGRAVFDHPSIVSAILWGNYHKLIRAVEEEVTPGVRMLQVACVYGEFSQRMADAVGPEGHLDVIDVANIQVDNCRGKLRAHPNTRVMIGDAVDPPEGPFDVVCSFFLLHEVPEDYKYRVVEAVLSRVAPGGKAVFVDYHRPGPFHPLKTIMSVVFATLEPFARALWDNEIVQYAPSRAGFQWSKTLYFGGLYQKVVARRLP